MHDFHRFARAAFVFILAILSLSCGEDKDSMTTKGISVQDVKIPAIKPEKLSIPLFAGEWVDNPGEPRGSYYFLNSGDFYFRAVPFENWESRFFGVSGKWRIVESQLAIAVDKIYFWNRALSHDENYRYGIQVLDKVHWSSVDTNWATIGNIDTYATNLDSFLHKSSGDDSGLSVGLREFESWKLKMPVKFSRVGDPRQAVSDDSLEIYDFQNMEAGEPPESLQY